MITASNTDEITKQLEEFSKEVERKMKNMIAGFAREVAITASENTPVGSNDMFVENTRYRNYYLNRQDEYGLPIEPGYHSGAWQYTEGSPTFKPVIFTTEDVANDVFNEAEVSYKLGDIFAIAATGPAFADLENGSSIQAPQGIGIPTVAQIQTAHQADLKKYYDAG